MQENKILNIITSLPDGYFEGEYQKRKYGITKSIFNNGNSYKLFAKELRGNDFISLNFYKTTQNEILRPCEMPKQKVIHFLKNVKII